MNDVDQSAPAWTRGFDLAFLKEVVALQKAVLGPHSYGAWGLLAERDIAAACAKDEFHAVKDSSGKVIAFALAHLNKVASSQRDFTGRRHRQPKETLSIHRLCAPSIEIGAALLRLLFEKHRGPLLVEIFEEHMESREAVKAVGLRYSFSKVTAGSEVLGMYVGQGLNPVESLPTYEQASMGILQHSFLAGERLQAVMNELTAWDDPQKRRERWVQHYSSYNINRSWTAFALRGYDRDPLFVVYPEEMSKAWKAKNEKTLGRRLTWTAAAQESFPATTTWLMELPWGLKRVRFMRVAGGGGLSRHADTTDRQAGFGKGMNLRLHVPIETNEKSDMISWDVRGNVQRLNMPLGSLCYLDTRKPHAHHNESSEHRTHLVMDAIATTELQEMVSRLAPSS